MYIAIIIGFRCPTLLQMTSTVFEGFIANILFLYDLLQCLTSPLNAMPSYFCSLHSPFSISPFVRGAPFQFSVMWVSSFQPYQLPRPAHVFYKGLAKGFTIQGAYSSLFSLFVLCPFSPL